MTTLPMKRMTIYKHGIGYFERRGEVEEDTLRIHFPRQAMDDILKSMIAVDSGEGRVRGVAFETPENRAELLAKGSIHLSENHSLLDLMRDLRGRRVRCVVQGDQGEEQTLEGMVVGVEYGDSNNRTVLDGAMVTIYQPELRSVRSLPIQAIQRLDLLDEAADDLSYFLRAAQSEEERRTATLHLSPGKHKLRVSYIAPAPVWRVGYRMLVLPKKPRDKNNSNSKEANQQSSRTADNADPPHPSEVKIIVQGWGIFDNHLDEDLHEVDLTLVAGMPISFRYRLYEPKTPQRPLVEDEERTINTPVFFDAAPPPAPAAAGASAKGRAQAMRSMTLGVTEEDMSGAMADSEAAASYSLTPEALEQSAEIAIEGSERGALFHYYVAYPVTVARGESAMVPIIVDELEGRRDLLYNRSKLPNHPVVSVRTKNTTRMVLERGPVTILDETDYAGEAIIPFTREGGEIIIPYAVELGIKISEEHTRERRTVGIQISQEYLHIQEYDIQHITYHLTSTLANPTEVMIERSIDASYELTETAEPDEQTDQVVRWSVSCVPHARTVFKVHQRHMRRRRESISSLTAAQLHDYLRNKFLDEKTGQTLEEVLRLFRSIDEARKRIRRTEQQREAIYKQQKQIQGNLTPLRYEGEEGALRKRYVAELNNLEDRLEQLKKDEQRDQQKVTELEEEAKKKMEALTRNE